jgi:ABC-type branched-subunit amino acid transport system substrate-binding protein
MGRTRPGGLMRRLAVLVTTLGLAIGGLLAAGAPASAQSDAAPKASDIGVTAKEIHIAVVADVDNPFAPSLFQGDVNGVQAAVKYVNANGGVAGRKLVLDVIDSQLNPAKTRNAIITACQNDFALVGTAAAFMTTIEDEVNCKDQSGKTTGLPDFASFVTGVQQCSPVAYPVNPPQLVCDTKDNNPQTFYGGTGTSKYFQKIAGTKNLHGLYLASNDSAVATRQQDLLLAFPEHAGLKSDQHPYVSGTAPQSAYTPIVQKLKADGSNFAYSAMGSAAVIALRQEAELQGLNDPKMLWICISCYDETLPAADSAQGTYEPLGILPFEEAKYNKNLAALVKLVGNGKLDQFSIYGFAATLLFKQAVEDAVAKSGAGGVTRADVLTAAKGITSFDAGGMIGANNIAERKTGPCFLVMQVKNKKWKRAYPAKPGTFDCNPKNETTIQRDQEG